MRVTILSSLDLVILLVDSNYEILDLYEIKTAKCSSFNST
ncbi:hypothetical protein T05_7643 [Trichinella murrelli]|uniref:Uncharacterized protein n=1 Tax=Trichinella murrelli TaxID=144512 RepID=A0A0V0SWI5_9BILA|nr:hypothetical protein T05_7643 [Trichinella murrelli]